MKEKSTELLAGSYCETYLWHKRVVIHKLNFFNIDGIEW